jgi:hypothetical protein
MAGSQKFSAAKNIFPFCSCRGLFPRFVRVIVRRETEAGHMILRGFDLSGVDLSTGQPPGQ